MVKKSKRGAPKADGSSPQHAHVHHHQGEGSHHHHKLHEGAWYKAHHKTKSKQQSQLSATEDTNENAPSLVNDESSATLNAEDYKCLSEEKKKRLQDLKHDSKEEESGTGGLLKRVVLWICLLVIILCISFLYFCRMDSNLHMQGTAHVCRQAEPWVEHIRQHLGSSFGSTLSVDKEDSPMNTKTDDVNLDASTDDAVDQLQQKPGEEGESTNQNESDDAHEQGSHDGRASAEESSDDGEIANSEEVKHQVPREVDDAEETTHQASKDTEATPTPQQPANDSDNDSSRQYARHYLPRRFRHFRKMAETQSAAAAEHHNIH